MGSLDGNGVGSAAHELVRAHDGPPAFATDIIFSKPSVPHREPVAKELFDEIGYLRLNPDVRTALERGEIESGYWHYVQHGFKEGRAVPSVPHEPRDVMVIGTPSGALELAPANATGAVDVILVAPNRGLMVVGWIDDTLRPLNCIRIIGPDWRVVLDADRLVRVRRADAEKALGSHAQHAYGFFGFLTFDGGGEVAGTLQVEFWQQGGASTILKCSPTRAEDVELRNTALAYLAGASFFGNTQIEAIRAVARGVGDELIRFNKLMTQRVVASPYVEHFGRRPRALHGSIIVCLYGKPEFYFLQQALFSGRPGIENYEFIYVSNSPELAEILLSEARSATLTYGLPSSVMLLSGNAGFGGANNAASQIASSDRLLAVNPDVFPYDADWAAKHSDVMSSAAAEQTQLFSAPLYYDDGSIMHGGMYFEVDVGISLAEGIPTAHRLCRVEHYGKGAPRNTVEFTRARPVPAVSGAFISVDRAWFEALGGFTEDFIFGHYEDADLCLKSIERGTPPWLHDIKMWHLEGKGSTRQPPHEGGSLINRWLFTRQWLPMIDSGLLGPQPSHPLFATPSAAEGEETENLLDSVAPRRVRRRSA